MHVHPLVQTASRLMGLVREHGPRVHCITNTVAENFTANVLLAAGAVPSMTSHPDEVEAFVKGAHGLMLNMGTPDEDRNASFDLAIRAAEDEEIPWVLDPVFVDRSPLRLERARSLLLRRPTVLRGNLREVDVLERRAGPGFAELCNQYGTVVACTGDTDRIESLERVGFVNNGHALMGKVTAMGCAISALVAAFCAAHEDAFSAAASALLIAGVCGERAAEEAAGPGSFVPRFLDALATLDEPAVLAAAQYAEEQV